MSAASHAAVFAVAAVGTPAFAADQKGYQGALAATAAVLVVTPLLQFALAILLPRFTLRAQRAIATGFWPCAGWGALAGTLVVVLVAVVGQGGPAGKGLAGAGGVVAVALALAGGTGLAKCLGDWALRRWDLPPTGPFSVLCGAVVWAWGAAVPIIGWVGGLLTLIAGLGAAVQVLLQPRAFDEPWPTVLAETTSGAGADLARPTVPAPPPLAKVSVIIPVYNEQSTVHEVIERVKALPLALQIIVVDDGSTDGTQEVLREEGEDEVVQVFTSPTNFGKGAAIRIGLSFVRGEVVIIQDADLELDPEEYPRLLEPIRAGRTNVVYGSRFLTPTPDVPRRTRLANRLLARWCNLLYWSRLTDVSTAYKVFRTPTLQQLGLRSIGFEFCAEVTAKLLRQGERIVEVPVGYHPRTALAGKKLNYLRDGLKAAWWLLWLRFSRPARQ